MALDERSRHELYLKLDEVLGPDRAATLMEMLPPVGWADVATKRDVAVMRLDLDQMEQRMGLRFESLEQRLRADFANQSRSLVLAMLGTSLAIVATTLGAVYALA